MAVAIRAVHCELKKGMEGCCPYDYFASGVELTIDGVAKFAKAPFEIRSFGNRVELLSTHPTHKLKIMHSDVIPSLFADKDALLDFVKANGGCCCDGSGGGTTNTNTPINGQIPALTLPDNAEESQVYTLTGFLASEYYSEPQITTDLSAYNVDISFQSIGIDDNIRVLIKNNSAATVMLPVINFSFLQIN